MLVLGSVMTQLSPKHIRQNGFICHMFHPQRSFEQKIRQEKPETLLPDIANQSPTNGPPHLGSNRFLAKQCRFDGFNDCWLEVATCKLSMIEAKM